MLIGGISKIGDTPMFMETTYIHPKNGQEYPMYVMNHDKIKTDGQTATRERLGHVHFGARAF